MEKWFVPQHMKSLAGCEVDCFGYDQTHQVSYQFNQLGFRGSYHEGFSVNVIGNSMAFGIGLAEPQVFGSIVSAKLGLGHNNFSFGCYLHENHDHLANLRILSQRTTDDIFVVQINNLDRLRDGDQVITGLDAGTAVRRFQDYFEQVVSLLAHRRVIFVYWDDMEYTLPSAITKKIAIHNKFCLDQSLGKNTFGPRSHRSIALALTALIDAGQFN